MGAGFQGVCPLKDRRGGALTRSLAMAGRCGLQVLYEEEQRCVYQCPCGLAYRGERFWFAPHPPVGSRG